MLYRIISSVLVVLSIAACGSDNPTNTHDPDFNYRVADQSTNKLIVANSWPIEINFIPNWVFNAMPGSTGTSIISTMGSYGRDHELVFEDVYDLLLLVQGDVEYVSLFPDLLEIVVSDSGEATITLPHGFPGELKILLIRPLKVKFKPWDFLLMRFTRST